MTYIIDQCKGCNCEVEHVNSSNISLHTVKRSFNSLQYVYHCNNRPESAVSQLGATALHGRAERS